MIRARFKTAAGDYRPITWPIQHPYWCTGYGEGYTVLVAYADSEDQIKELWPEAIDIDSEDADEYHFSDRFPKPEWMN